MNERHIDQELVNRAKKGEQRAFDMLVMKYHSHLVRLLMRFVKDEHEVYDIVQETFIKAYRALPKFRGECAFYTWLYRIGVNTAKTYLAQRNQRMEFSNVSANDEDDDSIALTDTIPDYNTPEASLISNEIATTIESAIEKLPDELRQTIILREIEGLSYEEIAELTNAPLGTVRSRIYRAREAIAKELRPILDTNENQRW